MNRIKTVFLLLVFAAVCFASAALCVYAAKAIADAAGAYYAGVPVTLSSRAAADGGSPYTVVYDGKEVRISDAGGKEIYRFAVAAGSVPAEELAELSRGVTVSDAEAVWALIESYTS